MIPQHPLLLEVDEDGETENGVAFEVLWGL